jgi:hypothetical protein
MARVRIASGLATGTDQQASNGMDAICKLRHGM